LEDDRPPERRGAGLGGPLAGEAAQDPLAQEEKGREQEQERNDPGEGLVARVREEPAPGRAAEKADGDEAEEPGLDGGELPAVSGHASGGAEEERGRAG